MKKTAILLGMLINLAVYGQKVFPATATDTISDHRPLLFYISGDGGWNRFSTAFVQCLNKKGFPVIGLDAKEYFWNRKTPQQAAQAVANLLQPYLNRRIAPDLIFIGYSFGADVLPFIEPYLPKALGQRVKRTILLSPSSTTDFEVHLLYGLGFYPKRDVPDAINHLSHPVTLVFGSEEDDFPLNRLYSNNRQVITLPGRHHYDGEVDTVIEHLLPQLKSE